MVDCCPGSGLDEKGFTEKGLVESRQVSDGVQLIYRFPNGYGASVIQRKTSYGYDEGLWELAVVSFIEGSDSRFDLCYDTSLTDNVIGYLTVDEVNEILEKIEGLDESE